MAIDSAVCVLCHESDPKESLIVLHEKFEHYLHAGCYSKDAIGMTCPLCTKPFCSQQSRELLDDELLDLFDKQQALQNNLKDKNYAGVKFCIQNWGTNSYAILDAFPSNYDVILSIIGSEMKLPIEVFFICAVTSDDLALIALALKWLCRSVRLSFVPSIYYGMAIDVCIKLRLFKVLHYLSVHDADPCQEKFIELIKMCCRENDIEAARNIINAHRFRTICTDPHIFAEANSDEMAELLLKSCPEKIFTESSIWRILDLECFMSRCSNDDTPFARVWEKIRVAGFKGKSLPPPYDLGEYRKRIRID